ncbi:MAG TPA: hypothetical protein VJS39_13515 [Gemmatimonadaceae bacterium]|nr:hypothetical protein [Gemmatimonadaceae bacterium]
MATGSLRELSPESAVSRHAATCPDCGPLLTQLRDREYQAATILNTLPPISDPIIVAETAGKLSQRRRMGSVVVTFASIALGLSIWFAAATLIPDVFDGGHGVVGLQTETIPLSCLSPQQAGDVISPYVRGRGRIYYTAKGVSAITVRATPSEIYQIREVLKNFDNPLATICRTSVKATSDALRKQLEAGATLEQVQRALEEQIRGNPSERPEALERPEQPERPEVAAKGEAGAPVLAGQKPSPGKKTKPAR